MVWNKADLAGGSLGAPGALAVSARTGERLDALRREVLACLDYRAPPPGTAVPFVQEHAAAIVQAQTLLDGGRLRQARQALAAVTRPSPSG